MTATMSFLLRDASVSARASSCRSIVCDSELQATTQLRPASVRARSTTRRRTIECTTPSRNLNAALRRTGSLSVPNQLCDNPVAAWRKPPCGHRPFPSRAASSRHGLPSMPSERRQRPQNVRHVLCVHARCNAHCSPLSWRPVCVVQVRSCARARCH